MDSARQQYRNHLWFSLFHRVEAFRCVMAVETALQRKRMADAEIWGLAFLEWLRRDRELTDAINARSH
jgi:hypothetical protein